MAVHDLGGGDPRPIVFKTDGKIHIQVHPRQPILEHQAVTDETAVEAAGGAKTFFRLSGGKWQYCVRFPTGSTQIICTEP